jgi:hypothetical protein
VSRIIRCAVCSGRIRPHAPRIGLIDLESGHEISYHARPRCRRRGMREMAALMERGKAYVLRHHHGAACPDKAPGFGCSGGCFDAPVAVAN